MVVIQNCCCFGNVEDLDVVELWIKEMEFMFCFDDNEYSDENSDELLD